MRPALLLLLLLSACATPRPPFTFEDTQKKQTRRLVMHVEGFPFQDALHAADLHMFNQCMASDIHFPQVREQRLWPKGSKQPDTIIRRYACDLLPKEDDKWAEHIRLICKEERETPFVFEYAMLCEEALRHIYQADTDDRPE